jgi:CBS domain-containing protein
MSIERLLTRPVQKLGPDATCTDAAQLMRDERIGAVVVEDRDERVVGIVTDRDLVVRVVAPGLDPRKVRLSEVMTREPVYLKGERGIDQLVAAMRDASVRRVPVVDRRGKLEGLVAMDDLFVLLATQLADLATAIRDEIEPK